MVPTDFVCPTMASSDYLTPDIYSEDLVFIYIAGSILKKKDSKHTKKKAYQSILHTSTWILVASKRYYIERYYIKRY